MTAPDHELDHDEIAQRAYAIAHNGHVSQSDEENWLQAENEIRTERAEQAPPKKSRKRRVAAVSNDAVPEAE